MTVMRKFVGGFGTASGLRAGPYEFGLGLWPHPISNRKNVEDAGNGFIKSQRGLSERGRRF